MRSSQQRDHEGHGKLATEHVEFDRHIVPQRLSGILCKPISTLRWVVW
jgi:hypothetical protein